jgi:Fe-S cluster assembly iron-binding protein IscA
MFTVTERAQQQILEYFKDKEKMPIRVFLNQGGCAGPSLAMAVDEKKETDFVHEEADIVYVIDSAFLEEAKPVNVDFTDVGFKISSSLKLGGGCSSCGSAGSCC